MRREVVSGYGVVQKNPAGRLRGSGGPAGASREVSVERVAMVHGAGSRRIPKMEEDVTDPHGSKANTFFQSSFMEMTNQPRALASSYRACVKVPTSDAGRPCAGP